MTTATTSQSQRQHQIEMAETHICDAKAIIQELIDHVDGDLGKAKPGTAAHDKLTEQYNDLDDLFGALDRIEYYPDFNA